MGWRWLLPKAVEADPRGTGGRELRRRDLYVGCFSGSQAVQGQNHLFRMLQYSTQD